MVADTISVTISPFPVTSKHNHYFVLLFQAVTPGKFGGYTKNLVKTMLHAEDRLELKLHKFRGKHKKHHWSIWMVGKQVQLELVKTIVQRAKAKSQRKTVAN